MTSRHRLGLRGRLFIAFGALTALTVLASMVSWVSYNRLGMSSIRWWKATFIPSA
ncbi:hypothetical protein [Aliamphritea spongicola]|nr:hypothetical protein [Aliamphritea spongicola]